MPITADDVVFRLTTKLGSVGDTWAGVPVDSLGKFVSTTTMGTGHKSLFDDLSTNHPLVAAKANLADKQAVLASKQAELDHLLSGVYTPEARQALEALVAEAQTQLASAMQQIEIASVASIDYRAVAVLNMHDHLTLQNAVLYIASEVPGGADISLAVDNIGPTSKDSTTAQGSMIADKHTAPAGVGAFSTPISRATGLPLGNIAAGEVKFFWARRDATSSTVAADGVTFCVIGNTSP